MRVAVKNDDGSKVYVMLAAEDQQETDSALGIVRRGEDRVTFNCESITPTLYGVEVANERNVTLYPWARVLWVDSRTGEL